VRHYFAVSTIDERHDRTETRFPFHCLTACGRCQGGCLRSGASSRDCNSEHDECDRCGAWIAETARRLNLRVGRLKAILRLKEGNKKQEKSPWDSDLSSFPSGLNIGNIIETTKQNRPKQ